MWRATHHIAMGRFDASLAEIRKAVELDPLSMIILSDVGRDIYLARRYDEAIEQYQKLLRFYPDSPIAHKGLAEVYVQKGMHEQAILEIENAIQLSGRSIFILDDLGYVYARAGHKGKAEQILKDLNELDEEEFVPSYGRVVIYATLQDKDKAMYWFEKAFEERSFLVYVKVALFSIL
jgi:tetratricopeptide (TPR) repeat protein